MKAAGPRFFPKCLQAIYFQLDRIGIPWADERAGLFKLKYRLTFYKVFE